MGGGLRGSRRAEGDPPADAEGHEDVGQDAGGGEEEEDVARGFIGGDAFAAEFDAEEDFGGEPDEYPLGGDESPELFDVQAGGEVGGERDELADNEEQSAEGEPEGEGNFKLGAGDDVGEEDRGGEGEDAGEEGEGNEGIADARRMPTGAPAPLGMAPDKREDEEGGPAGVGVEGAEEDEGGGFGFLAGGEGDAGGEPDAQADEEQECAEEDGEGAMPSGAPAPLGMAPAFGRRIGWRIGVHAGILGRMGKDAMLNDAMTNDARTKAHVSCKALRIAAQDVGCETDYNLGSEDQHEQESTGGGTRDVAGRNPAS